MVAARLRRISASRIGRLLVAVVASSLLMSVPSAALASNTKYGIAYFVWHCVTRNRPLYDLSQILKNGTPPGPVPEFHWWAKPAEGYYCLSDNDRTLRDHARLLAQAGIDFVFVDFSNHDSMNYDRVNLEYLDPLAHLLSVWSKIPNAPKVVPFVPVTKKGDLYSEIVRRLFQYPNLLFDYLGKPLFLIVDNQTFPPDSSKRAQLDLHFTTRLMWDDNSAAGDWMFISRCRPGFLESRGAVPCRQRVAFNGGRAEQVSVAAAFQRDYMSNDKTAVPRFGGLTFLRQMQRSDDFKGVPIVTILGWNQWIAQRHCVTPGLAPDDRCASGDGRKIGANYIFTDEYDEEYSNDFEPGGSMGDTYYRLLSCEIHRRKFGGNDNCWPGKSEK